VTLWLCKTIGCCKLPFDGRRKRWYKLRANPWVLGTHAASLCTKSRTRGPLGPRPGVGPQDAPCIPRYWALVPPSRPLQVKGTRSEVRVFYRLLRVASISISPKLIITAMKLVKRHPLLALANSYLIDSPAPSNLSYLWNFGSLLGTCLALQIITGVTLAMHYIGSVDLAFSSVEHES
jgi:hypothetical protein